MEDRHKLTMSELSKVRGQMDEAKSEVYAAEAVQDTLKKEIAKLKKELSVLQKSLDTSRGVAKQRGNELQQACANLETSLKNQEVLRGAFDKTADTVRSLTSSIVGVLDLVAPEQGTARPLDARLASARQDAQAFLRRSLKTILEEALSVLKLYSPDLDLAQLSQGLRVQVSGAELNTVTAAVQDAAEAILQRLNL